MGASLSPPAKGEEVESCFQLQGLSALKRPLSRWSGGQAGPMWQEEHIENHGKSMNMPSKSIKIQ